MKIFIVERGEDKGDYDEVVSVVVKAESPERAYVLAIIHDPDFKEDGVTVEEIHLDDKEGVIHQHFLYG